jgi:cation diffusion facilitator family transporter
VELHPDHDHVFGQDRPRVGERRTQVVVALTAVTMAVEIAAGIAFGSMALLADGLHMASHALALGIAALAYLYARREARNEKFSFGTGKVNALAGYTGAVLLGIFAAAMAAESVARLFRPVAIVFDQAIAVAVVGLLVNALSVVVLGGHHLASRGEEGDARDHHEDHNLRSAYLHVLADALTSILAIAALLSGKLLGLTWLDPAMGIVGAALVTHWALGLLRSTGRVLLDRQASEAVRGAIMERLEAAGARVTDLHVWSIGPGIRAAEIVLVAREPLRPEEYRGLLPPDLGIVHATVEVRAETPETPRADLPAR